MLSAFSSGQKTSQLVMQLEEKEQALHEALSSHKEQASSVLQLQSKLDEVQTYSQTQLAEINKLRMEKESLTAQITEVKTKMSELEKSAG
jgi:peptidoglycan hydrolase CwlO-like protein